MRPQEAQRVDSPDLAAIEDFATVNLPAYLTVWQHVAVG
jgi:hypothetical protein